MPRKKKRFGQHFLRDRAVLASIAAHIAPQASDHMLEIGPGDGALTSLLSDSVARLTLIEVDSDFSALLDKRFADKPRVKVLNQDILRTDIGTLSGENSLRVVGNLPYNITSPIIFKCLADSDNIYDMHFLVQREVGHRLAAEPGSRTYGRLSVMAQVKCEVRNLMDVPPDAFSPPPKVDSTLVSLRPLREDTLQLAHPGAFAHLVSAAFSMRRKKLGNALKNQLSREAIESVAVDPDLRPEQLTVEQFVALGNLFSKDALTSGK